VISKGLPFGLPERLPGGLTPAVIERAWHTAQAKLVKRVLALRPPHLRELRTKRIRSRSG